MRITVDSAHGMRLDDEAASSLWRRGQYDVALTSLTTAVLGDAGVLVLTGDPGTGKTALLHALNADVQARGVVVGRLLYPVLESVDFLSGIAEGFGLPGGFTTVAEFEDAFERFATSVAAHGGRLLLMIDDAHSLPRSSVREVGRLARRRWDDGRARLSVILAGDGALSAAVRAAKIERTVAVQLHPLTPEESAQFIAHLLRAADGMDSAALPPHVLEQICREARGIPQVMTVLVKRAIAKTRLSERRLVGEVTPTTMRPPPAATVTAAAPRSRRSFTVPPRAAAAVVVGVIVVAAAAGAGWYTRSGQGVRPAAAGGESSRQVAASHPAPAPLPAPASPSTSPAEVPAQPTSSGHAQNGGSVSDTAAASVKAARAESVPAAAEPVAAAPASPRTGADAARPAVPAPARESARPSADAPAPSAARVERRPALDSVQRSAERPAVRRERVDAREPRGTQGPSEVSRPASRPAPSNDDDDPGAIIDWVMKGR